MDEQARQGEGRLAKGVGLVGTGVHLLGRAELADGRVTGEVWLTLVCVPIVPFGRWTIASEGAGPSSLDATLAPRPLAALLTFVLSCMATAATLMPAAVALTVPIGNRYLELACILGSMALAVGLIAWIDETRVRIPLRTAMTVLFRRLREPSADRHSV